METEFGKLIEDYVISNLPKVKMRRKDKAFVSDNGHAISVSFDTPRMKDLWICYNPEDISLMTGSESVNLVYTILQIDVLINEIERVSGHSEFWSYKDLAKNHVAKVIVGNEEIKKLTHKIYQDVSEALRDELATGRHIKVKQEYKQKIAFKTFKEAVKAALKSGVDVSEIQDYINNSIVGSVSEE
jgi:hypothetical protein